MEQVFDTELELESSSSSSGCESGWTLYLQQDSNMPHDFSWKKPDQHHDQEEEDDEDEDEDDDMSMVSDASSGPPHEFQEHQDQDEDDDECGNDNDHVFCHPPIMTPRKRRKILINQTSFHSHQDHFQDHDTASSPFFTTNDLKVCNKEDNSSFDYSQGHSTTYFEMV